VWVSAPISAVAGLAMAFVTFFAFQLDVQADRKFERIRVRLPGWPGSLDVTPIPENGVGEIAYIQGGSRYTGPGAD